jgi:hypothetical protein
VRSMALNSSGASVAPPPDIETHVINQDDASKQCA